MRAQIVKFHNIAGTQHLQQLRATDSATCKTIESVSDERIRGVFGVVVNIHRKIGATSDPDHITKAEGTAAIMGMVPAEAQPCMMHVMEHSFANDSHDKLSYSEWKKSVEGIGHASDHCIANPDWKPTNKVYMKGGAIYW